MFINRYLIAFARGNGLRVAGTCCLQLLVTLLGTLISLFTAFVVRMIQGETRIGCFTGLWQVFAAIALLIALRYALGGRKALACERCSLSIKASLRSRLLCKLFALGPAYAGRERTGSVASTLSSKVEYLNEYFTIYLPAAVSAVMNAALLIAALWSFNRATALVCVAACAGMLVCPMLFYALMRERGAREMRAHARYYSDCLDSVQGLPTLKALNANGRRREVIHAKGEELRRAVMGQLSITMLENVALQFFAGLGSAVSVAVAAGQCASGRMAQENLVYALFLTGACFAPMLLLINAWHMGYRGVVASYSISDMLAEPTPMPLPMPSANREHLGGEIRFENVSFAYSAQEGDVLHGVSFTAPEHTTTALVGVSGSGKSTVAQLLAGFYPVRSGRITVGGRRLDGESVGDIQNRIAAVWQDCRLFYGTVEENIRLGKPDATREEVEQAARQANIHAFIMSLPEGYGTRIGERGMRFSGGERQRVALARAFLRDAPIVILDEATSSLDRRNEREIQQSLRRLSRGKTSLVIAHRLATVQSADQILLMEGGRVVQRGTHEQLMRTCERYRELMGEQMTGGQSDEA